MFVIYPGSFDPLTLGHEDIIKRAASSFEEVMIAVSEDNAKSSIFSVNERLKMAEIVAKKYTNVSASSFKGLTVDFAKANATNFILRGLREDLFSCPISCPQRHKHAAGFCHHLRALVAAQGDEAKKLRVG